MSGHSKWATIKRQKAVTDAKKGAAFTRLTKNISVAARNGKDPEMNAALRSAIDKARAANMPKDNIEKAILKGAGELPGVTYEEALYEGYGPGGVAMMMECVTDNTNRTVSQLRALFGDYGGSLGSSGSVKYLFEQKGVVRVAAEELKNQDKEAMELYLIDGGAEDIKNEEEGMTVIAPRAQMAVIVHLLEDQGVKPASAEVEWITKTMATPSAEDKAQVQKLIEELENNDDVNAVYTNLGV